jgi:hypothetical protein
MTTFPRTRHRFSPAPSVKQIMRRARHARKLFGLPITVKLHAPHVRPPLPAPAPCGRLLRHLSIPEIALLLQMVVMRNSQERKNCLEDLERRQEEAGMSWHASFSVTVPLCAIMTAHGEFKCAFNFHQRKKIFSN